MPICIRFPGSPLKEEPEHMKNMVEYGLVAVLVVLIAVTTGSTLGWELSALLEGIALHIR